MEKYRQFVMDGVQHERDRWSNLKGQIYLGNETFGSSEEFVGNKRGFEPVTM